jgi:hypothetical protein
MAPNTRSISTPGSSETAPQGANQATRDTSHGTPRETQESDEFLETLRRDVEVRKARNNLLAEAAIEYRREFGDDLSKYPDHVATYVRTQKGNESVVSAALANVQRAAGEVPQYRPRPSNMNPEPYKGKNSQERVEYIQTCERVFDYSPIEYSADRNKIGWAAVFLREEPAKNWHRLRENHPEKLEAMSWKDYILFLDNLLLQPDARRLLTSQKYESAKQGPKQSILSFVNYLEELEAELDPFTDIQKRDNLFNKVRPEIRKRLVENGMATRQLSREDLIAAISLSDSSYLDSHHFQEKDKGKGKDKDKEKETDKKSSDSKDRDRKGRKRKGFWRKGGDTSKNSQRSGPKSSPDKQDKRDKKEVTCWTCNKVGHISPDCPDKDTSKTDKTGKRSRTNIATPITKIGGLKKKFEIGVNVSTAKGLRATSAVLDPGSDDDLISKPLALAFGFQINDTPLGEIGGLNGEPGPIYGLVETKLQITDSVGQSKSTVRRLYIVDMPGIDLILGLLWFEEVNPIVDWTNKKWRYNYDFNFNIIEPKKLDKMLKTRVAYALMPDQIQCNAGESSTIPPEYLEYQDVFSEQRADELPPVTGKTHEIEIREAEPPHGPIYALSAVELKALREYLDSSLKKGWIRHSISPAGAPILFVPKKDGGLRLCVDYRGLNKITVKNRHPLPLIGEMLDRLQGTKLFTKLDLRNTYYRIRIKPSDE